MGKHRKLGATSGLDLYEIRTAEGKPAGTISINTLGVGKMDFGGELFVVSEMTPAEWVAAQEGQRAGSLAQGSER